MRPTAAFLLLAFVAGCGPRRSNDMPASPDSPGGGAPPSPAAAPPSPADAPAAAPAYRDDDALFPPVAPVSERKRTGLEFQPERGTRAGERFLNGALVAQRVTDDSAHAVLHGTIQLRSKSADPIFAEYRVFFFDDSNQAVGPVFSVWKPFAVDEAFGTYTLHAAATTQGAVYFKLEVR